MMGLSPPLYISYGVVYFSAVVVVNSATRLFSMGWRARGYYFAHI